MGLTWTIIIKNIYNTTTIVQGEHQTCQFVKWKIDHTTLAMVGMYSPPLYSNLDFLGEFTEWLTGNIVLDPNIVITGDLNLHINNPNDDDTANFKDAMVALGFTQHILFPTHKCGNTLELTFMETYSNIKVEHAGKASSSLITALSPAQLH